MPDGKLIIPKIHNKLLELVLPAAPSQLWVKQLSMFPIIKQRGKLIEKWVQ
jgi:hypothetical protein